MTRQLIPPPDNNLSKSTSWALVLHPSEGETRSKGGVWDESIMLNSNYTKGLESFFRVLIDNRDGRPLWPFNHKQLLEAL
eukprot:6925824-Karenia_brevis.AAC.1